jgi:hypothetical protein
MITANTSVMALATMMGMLLLSIPKMSHSSVPVEKSKYIKSEILRVSLVRMVFIACGKNDPVVKAAAINPRMVTNVIYKISL